MKIILIIIIMFFASYGIMDIILAMFTPSKDRGKQYIVIKYDGGVENAENKIRSITEQYKNCEIVVINETNDNEVNYILEQFSRKNNQLHIIKKDELSDIFL